MHLIVRLLDVGLLIWMALFAAILFGRVMRGDTHRGGGFLVSRHGESTIAPERALSMAVFPVVIVGYAFSALHADVTVTKSLPELSNNMLMLLTGGNGAYLAGKIARVPPAP